MSPLAQRIILIALSLIEYVLAWEPAPVSPDVTAKAEELRASLKASAESLATATKQQ